MIWGPYISVKDGVYDFILQYEAKNNGKAVEPAGMFRITKNSGKEILKEDKLPFTNEGRCVLEKVKFNNDRNVEFVVLKNPQGEMLLKSITVIRKE